MHKIALIGLGPHAKRIYYPYLEELTAKDSSFRLELVIDLKMNQGVIEKFLSSRDLKPRHTLFLDTEGQISPTRISPEAAKALREHGITRAIIATEPKAHMVYLKECVKLGIPAVVDKPVTAPTRLTPRSKLTPLAWSLRASDAIAQDIKELQSLLARHPKSRILVQCQRRSHPGYNYVLKELSSVVAKYKIPINYIDIHHSDGMWNMPDEFTYRENHPYKYGYGKLMHSGYHFVDLLASLVRINEQLDGKVADSLEMFTQSVRPLDQHLAIGQEQYELFFGKDKSESLKPYLSAPELSKYGEVDSFTQVQLKKRGRVLTTAQVSLMQLGFSQRAWADLPEDSYKSNGRIRHESVKVHVGPLFSMQVHSYQSTERTDATEPAHQPGGINHFDIYVFRNTKLIGGQPFECIQYGREDQNKHTGGRYLGHNESARYKVLDELMYSRESNSELSDHIHTNRLLALMHSNHIKQYYGTIPHSKVKYREVFK